MSEFLFVYFVPNTYWFPTVYSMFIHYMYNFLTFNMYRNSEKATDEPS